VFSPYSATFGTVMYLIISVQQTPEPLRGTSLASQLGSSNSQMFLAIYLDKIEQIGVGWACCRRMDLLLLRLERVTLREHTVGFQTIFDSLIGSFVCEERRRRKDYLNGRAGHPRFGFC
jgi:hypothetical protein